LRETQKAQKKEKQGRTEVIKSPEELEEIEETTSKATPGPWIASECNVKECWCKWVGVPDDPEGIDKWIIPTGDVPAADAEFIAMARTAVPKMAAMIRDLLKIAYLMKVEHQEYEKPQVGGVCHSWCERCAALEKYKDIDQEIEYLIGKIPPKLLEVGK
jgi:hypothetical protein